MRSTKYFIYNIPITTFILNSNFFHNFDYYSKFHRFSENCLALSLDWYMYVYLVREWAIEWASGSLRWSCETVGKEHCGWTSVSQQHRCLPSDLSLWYRLDANICCRPLYLGVDLLKVLGPDWDPGTRSNLCRPPGEASPYQTVMRALATVAMHVKSSHYVKSPYDHI